MDREPNPVAAGSPDPLAALPADFRWGVATSAYQIEGAVTEDGRGPSIWDTYAHTPGMVDNGDHADTACDHYHRMPADVALLADLGVDTYRFSVAWPRVQPTGRGPANQAGLAFYDRLVDELLGHGIDPWLTLYHWDLPQELEDAGGWPERDTAHRFADYAQLVHAKLGDRVRHWSTLNEPWCSSVLGYFEGRQAPGRRSFPDAVRAIHHLLLGHGLAAIALRESATAPLELGITLNMALNLPAEDTPADRAASRFADGLAVRVWMDALRLGRYPQDVVDDFAIRGAALPVLDGDLDVISTPIDVLGVNYYFGGLVSGVDESGALAGPDGVPVVREVARPHLPRTHMDWEIDAPGFTDLLVRLSADYPGLPMVITENGSAFVDTPDADGFVDDPDREAYLADHIAAVAEARAKGADVRGYLAWSFLDNFEWSYGYDKRFGLVRVDYDTQKRTVKRSGLWYRDLIARARSAPQHRA
ncbi:GH1 family beta-glucosidase [Actinokineospora guangxiensis]|uniref:Beta-glucosidase n=1 Tax=Actinokineospora guangxiensis TaxID=1490288 RepID=A0ABW0ESN6_9PSEU